MPPFEKFAAEIQARQTEGFAILERLRRQRDELEARLAEVNRAISRMGGLAKPGSLTARVLRFVREHPGSSAGEIGAAIACPSAYTTPCTLTLRRRLVRVRGADRRWRYYLPGDLP